MKDIKEILCDNLLELRKNAGITQKDLSNSLNVSDKSVSRWERGDSVPDLALLKKLAEFYNVSVDYLLTEQKPVSENRQKYNENISLYFHILQDFTNSPLPLLNFYQLY